MTATTRFGYLGGGLLTALGALGFAITGLDAPFAPTGHHLLVLEINPAQNLVHVAVGLALVAGGAASARAARTSALVATGVLGTLGLFGLLLADPAGNRLALNGWADALHVGLAAWGVAATLRHDQRGTTPRSTAARHP